MLTSTFVYGNEADVTDIAAQSGNHHYKLLFGSIGTKMSAFYMHITVSVAGLSESM